MRARVVIGANFGDEGKGLVTDYLCANEGAGMVVRFNGGAQAGHTVVTPEGVRHVFSHFGSGTLLGVPTFLSQFFVCNPILFMQEINKLHALGLPEPPIVYAHPACNITTFADMMINQALEDAKGDKRHGSVGVGMNETVNRSKLDSLRITVGDLWNGANIHDRLAEICGKWATFRTGKPIASPDAMIDAFHRTCTRFADLVHPLGIQQCEEPVFEGAQGLMLSQDRKELYPHVTRSYTGMRNVRVLMAQAGIADADIYYVSRTYLTRHGAGPLPGEARAMSFPDETNLEHPYQGRLRFAPLDAATMRARCEADAGQAFKLVLTHCDQLGAPTDAALYAHGPTRNLIGARER